MKVYVMNFQVYAICAPYPFMPYISVLQLKDRPSSPTSC